MGEICIPSIWSKPAKANGEPNQLDSIGVLKPEDIELTVEPAEQLDFAEDPAEALLILLNITHFRFNGVPSAFGLRTLSELATLCDQYDCVHLVKP
jgi:hypothetical protein